jgi:hypothetical protein
MSVQNVMAAAICNNCTTRFINLFSRPRIGFVDAPFAPSKSPQKDHTNSDGSVKRQGLRFGWQLWFDDLLPGVGAK